MAPSLTNLLRAANIRDLRIQGGRKTDAVVFTQRAQTAASTSWALMQVRMRRLVRQIVLRNFEAVAKRWPEDKADWQPILDRELQMDQIMHERSLTRVQRDILAVANLPLKERGPRLRAILKRERRYERLHVEQVFRRSRRAAEWVALRKSPMISAQGGAVWVMDPKKKEHTPDCLIMANRAWSWDILRYVNPGNRHPGCGCRLVSMRVARGRGIIGRSKAYETEFPAGVDRGYDMGPFAAGDNGLTPSADELLRGLSGPSS